MALINYLTSYKLYLERHVRQTYTFTDTSGLSAEAVKTAVFNLTTGSSVPIPSASYEWFSTLFRYVRDKERMYVYDNTHGLWHFERNETMLRNVVIDYFTVIAEHADASNDAIHLGYANSFFASPSKLQNLVRTIMTAVHMVIPKSEDIVERTRNYRYFETIDGRRALLDMSQPKFNLKVVKFTATQPLLLEHIAPYPIATVDTPPTTWLQLISDYMMGDPERIEYFEKVLAYLTASYNYNQAFVYFIGGGRNGKSTIIKVLQDILGPLAVRMNSDLLNARPSHAFKRDDALAATEGRSLYIFNEIDEDMTASTRSLKELTEGALDNPTVIRPAYSPNYTVTIAGIPLITANSLMDFDDGATLDPIFKRMILVPFDFQIVQEDPTILARLRAEYPQIQAWLYMNHFKHKGILIKDEPKPLRFQQEYDKYRSDTDNIGAFWRDAIEVTGNSSDQIKRSDIYRMYEQYCKANGRKPMGNKGTNGFANHISKYYSTPGVSQIKPGNVHTIAGVKRSAAFDADIVGTPNNNLGI